MSTGKLCPLSDGKYYTTCVSRVQLQVCMLCTTLSPSYVSTLWLLEFVSTCACVCVCVHQHCLESRTHSFQIGFPGPVFVCVSECLYRGLFCFLYQPCMQGFSKWLLKSVYMFILGCLLAAVYTHLTQVFSVIYSARVLYVYCRSIAIDKITYVFVCVCMCIL